MTTGKVLGVANNQERWSDKAECRKPDVADVDHYAEDTWGRFEAKAVCAACEVQVECLTAALENDERYGIWGGLDETERAAIKKRNREARA